MMKSTISNNNCPKKSTYPCLKTTEQGLLVLFNFERCGVVVSSPNGSQRALGEYRNDWSEGVFAIFTGTVCLENGD